MDKVKMSAYVAPGVLDIPLSLPPWEPALVEITINVLCKYYQVSRRELLGKGRYRELVYIRHLFAYWFRRYYYGQATATSLGKALDRDHTTIIHGHSVFSDWLETNSPVPDNLRTRYRTTVQDFNETSKLIRDASWNIRKDQVRQGRTGQDDHEDTGN